MYMFRSLLISMFITSTVLATTWTVGDDGKADFDNMQTAATATVMVQAPICIDGVLDDWVDVSVAVTDPTGDAFGGIDFTALSAADDELFFFLRIEAVEDFDLSENNALRIYLDTDVDASTGFSIGGIGAELEWHVGEIEGTFHHAGQQTTVYHQEILFRGQPTVTSNDFEIAFGRDVLPDGTNPLFSGPNVRVLIADGTGGDWIPDPGMPLTYTFDIGSAPPAEARVFDRMNDDHLRIITHNVKDDRPFSNAHQAKFERLWSAVSPDILHLQEISNHSAAETRDLVASWLGGVWFAAGHSDCKTVSRYPITDTWTIDGNLAMLIDTSVAIGTQLLAINAHFPCCGNDTGRQQEADAVMAFIRDAYLPGGDLTLSADVPVMISGDLNLVGLAQQLETVVSGDIYNNNLYGEDFDPDPDGTALHNIVSRLTEKRMGYTYRNNGSHFWPGHLDFMIYSDSNLRRRHDFLVCTPEMSDDALAANGLLAGDSNASDHLVFCVDFALPCDADISGDGIVNINDLLTLIANWNTSSPLGDVNEDGIVDVSDLLIVVGNWGPCE